ncbi:hypothetical protein G7054_g12116 [Neopestalotiopsis clavispora]|nr:hypothetical protein G7054_g12116 [Neopestalotiopsis clavispora]
MEFNNGQNVHSEDLSRMDTTEQSRRAKRQRLDPTGGEQNTSRFDESSITQWQGSASNLSMFDIAGQSWAQNRLSNGMHYHQYHSPVPFTGYLEPSSSWPSVYPAVNINPMGYRFNGPVIEQVPCHQPRWRPQPETYIFSGNAEQMAEPVSDQLKYNVNEANSEVEQSAPVATEITELFCFGMVANLSGTLERRHIQNVLVDLEVKMESSQHFTLVGNEHLQGNLHVDYGQMMQMLLDEEMLQLFVTCSTSKIEQSSRNSSKLSALIPCTLDIVVYGPSSLHKEIGPWFQQFDIFLQDPRICHLDAKYFNPHRLSADFNCCQLLSEVISKSAVPIQLSEISQRPDLLSILSECQDLEEAPQPAIIGSILKRHQKQALSFMLSRENGWGFCHRQKKPDLWVVVDTTQGRQYLNTVSEASQIEEPSEFAGGIVADPMGLGKTLTMISLVATDIERSCSFQESYSAITEEKAQVAATLIIVPPPCQCYFLLLNIVTEETNQSHVVLGTWEHELNTHVVHGALHHRRYHGKTRMNSLSEFEDIHVVLTTYHTVSAEWRSQNVEETSVLFSVKWNRIILDEGTMGSNGTPIQNRLSDFATLLQFIRAHPYDDPRYFETDVANLWKFGEETEAVKRLKQLSHHFVLRRPNNTIDLPARHDLLCPVDFTRDERTVYKKIRMQTLKTLGDALYGGSQSSKAGSHMNALQQIESLRLFCSLGLQFHSHRKQPAAKSRDIVPESWPETAQKAFHAQRAMYPMICLQCDTTFEIFESLTDGNDGLPPSVYFSSCLQFACCGHQPSCRTALVSLSNAALDDAPSLDDFSLDHTPDDGLSSKVLTLISHIKLRPDDEKCIVFSTWRLTLDMIQKGLDEAGISCVRFDGKVPQRNRQPIVERFKTDSSIRVMLLTLACGAVGLTLTVANRAYLMEPHWNPNLEDQALARIHRLGQTKEVTTVRLYMRDSFEEKVMELQQSKRSLAGVLLSQHDGGQTDDKSQSELQRLRDLL